MNGREKYFLSYCLPLTLMDDINLILFRVSNQTEKNEWPDYLKLYLKEYFWQDIVLCSSL